MQARSAPVGHRAGLLPGTHELLPSGLKMMLAPTSCAPSPRGRQMRVAHPENETGPAPGFEWRKAHEPLRKVLDD